MQTMHKVMNATDAEIRRRADHLAAARAALALACANCHYRRYGDGAAACRPSRCSVYAAKKDLRRIARECVNGAHNHITGALFAMPAMF